VDYLGGTLRVDHCGEWDLSSVQPRPRSSEPQVVTAHGRQTGSLSASHAGQAPQNTTSITPARSPSSDGTMRAVLPSEAAPSALGISPKRLSRSWTTGQVEGRPRTPEEQGKDPAAVKPGQLGGAKGGRARTAALPEQKRKQFAKKAAKTRWKTAAHSE
jgi:hypothetical protein